MMFSVIFSPKGPNDQAIEGEIGKFGMDFVKLIREENKEYDIPIDKIHNTCHYNTHNVQIKTIDENIINKISHFNGNDEVHVTVKKNSLSKYLNMVSKIRLKDVDITPWYKKMFGKHEFKKEFERVYIEYEVDKDSILRDWINDGCPLEWKF